MRSYTKNVAVYSAAHFFTDFACAYLVLSSVSGVSEKTEFFIIYNFFAFALQLPAGIAADKICRDRFFAAAGLALIAVSCAFSSVPWALVCLAGLGNALFHVGGGRDVLCIGKGRYTPLGIFVSPGAIGLYFGGMLSSGAVLPRFAAAAFLVLLAALVLTLKDFETGTGQKRTRTAFLPAGAAVAVLFIVVLLRSYGGSAMAFPWKTGLAAGIAAVFCLAGGKALGGILADRFGDIAISCLSLVLCAALALFYKNIYCGLAAILLFNMTMPLTLGGAARLFPKAPGAVFGLMTFGLYLGLLPAFSGISAGYFMPWGLMGACVFSALLLALGLKRRAYA